jgi:hypothetical protein
MKIKSIHFQRNGVAGECFYTVYYTDRHPEFGDMVATFTTDPETSRKINRTTCRAISLTHPELAYRGDEVADELQRELNDRIKQSKWGLWGFSHNNYMKEKQA